MGPPLKSNLVAGAGLTLAVLVALATSWIGGAASERVALADLRGSNCDFESVGTVDSEPLTIRGDFDEPCWSEGGIGIVPVDSYWRLIEFNTEGGMLSVLANRPSSQVHLQLNQWRARQSGDGSIEAEVRAGTHFLRVSVPRSNVVAPIEFELTLRIVPEQPEEQRPPTPITERPPTVAPQPPTAEEDVCERVDELFDVGTDSFLLYYDWDESEAYALCPQHSYAFQLRAGFSFDVSIATDGVLLEIESPEAHGTERLVAGQSATITQPGRYVFRLQRLWYVSGPLNYEVDFRLNAAAGLNSQEPLTPEPEVWSEWQFEGDAQPAANAGVRLTGFSSASTSVTATGRITHLYLDFMLNMPSGSCERAVVMVSRGDGAWHLLTTLSHEDTSGAFTRIGFDLRGLGAPFSEQLQLRVQSAFVSEGDSRLEIRNLEVSLSTEDVPEHLARDRNDGIRRITVDEPCFGAGGLGWWEFSGRHDRWYTVNVLSLGMETPVIQVFSRFGNGQWRLDLGSIARGETIVSVDFRADENTTYKIAVRNPVQFMGEGLYGIVVTERVVDELPTPEASPEPYESITYNFRSTRRLREQCEHPLRDLSERARNGLRAIKVYGTLDDDECRSGKTFPFEVSGLGLSLRVEVLVPRDVEIISLSHPSGTDRFCRSNRSEIWGRLTRPGQYELRVREDDDPDANFELKFWFSPITDPHAAWDLDRCRSDDDEDEEDPEEPERPRLTEFMVDYCGREGLTDDCMEAAAKEYERRYINRGLDPTEVLEEPTVVVTEEPTRVPLTDTPSLTLRPPSANSVETLIWSGEVMEPLVRAIRECEYAPSCLLQVAISNAFFAYLDFVQNLASGADGLVESTDRWVAELDLGDVNVRFVGTANNVHYFGIGLLCGGFCYDAHIPFTGLQLVPDTNKAAYRAGWYFQKGHNCGQACSELGHAEAEDGWYKAGASIGGWVSPWTAAADLSWDMRKCGKASGPVPSIYYPYSEDLKSVEDLPCEGDLIIGLQAVSMIPGIGKAGKAGKWVAEVLPQTLKKVRHLNKVDDWAPKEVDEALFDIDKAVSDFKNYVDVVSNAKKGNYDDHFKAGAIRRNLSNKTRIPLVRSMQSILDGFDQQDVNSHRALASELDGLLGFKAFVPHWEKPGLFRRGTNGGNSLIGDLVTSNDPPGQAKHWSRLISALKKENPRSVTEFSRKVRANQNSYDLTSQPRRFDTEPHPKGTDWLTTEFDYVVGRRAVEVHGIGENGLDAENIRKFRKQIAVVNDDPKLNEMVFKLDPSRVTAKTKDERDALLAKWKGEIEGLKGSLNVEVTVNWVEIDPKVGKALGVPTPTGVPSTSTGIGSTGTGFGAKGLRSPLPTFGDAREPAESEVKVRYLVAVREYSIGISGVPFGRRYQPSLLWVMPRMPA